MTVSTQAQKQLREATGKRIPCEGVVGTAGGS